MSEPSPPGLLSDTVGSVGRVGAVIAGAGAFLYLVGVVVLWQRRALADLPEQEVLAEIPRDQVAAAGVEEAALSAISGVLFALLLYAGYRLFRLSQRFGAAGGFHGRCARWTQERPVVVLTATVAVSCALVGPLTRIGLLFLAVFLTVTFVCGRSAHRSLIGESQDFRASAVPWLRVAAGLSAAVFLVSIVRQHEFPADFAIADVRLDEGTACGLYLDSSSDVVVLGVPAKGLTDERCRARSASRPTTLVIARRDIKQITLTAQPPRPADENSLLRRLGVPLECVVPICRVSGEQVSILTFGGSMD